MAEPAAKDERVKSSAVKRMTGLSLKRVQELAAAGKIPSAAKLGGEWTFDPLRVRRWIKRKEDEVACRNETSTDDQARRSGTRASKSMDATNDEAYEQALR